MKLLSLSSAALVALCSSLNNGVDAFTQPQIRTTRSSAPSSSSLNLNLPRLELPDAITNKLEKFDLKNPNNMDEEEYKGYSGAAIFGTLLFFLLPGAILTGIPDEIGDIVGGILPDFAFSAITGGGLAIYLSLRKDEIGATVRGYGGELLDTVGLPTLRYDLPAPVTDAMEQKLDLLNPNTLDEKDYNGYAGAAVAGTLLFFLLPGAAITGEFDFLGELGGSVVKDFLVAALIGGGLAIYLSLRDDEIGDAVNRVGGSFLDTVDDVLEKSTKLLPEAEDVIPAVKEISQEEEVASPVASSPAANVVDEEPIVPPVSDPVPPPESAVGGTQTIGSDGMRQMKI